jgi:hypothetical protein
LSLKVVLPGIKDVQPEWQLPDAAIDDKCSRSFEFAVGPEFGTVLSGIAQSENVY